MATLFVLFFLFALLCTWCAKLQSKLGRPLQWSDLQVAVSGVPYQMALLGKEIIPTINQIKESWKKDGPELMATLREFPRVVLQWVHRKCNIVNSTITIGVIVLSFVGVLVMWGDIASFIPLLIGAAFLLVRTLIVLLLSKVIHSIPRGVWIGIFIGLSMAMSCGEAEAASVVAYSSFNASFYAAAIFLPLVVAAIAGLIVRHWAIARKLLMVSMAIILFPACYGAPALSGYGLMVLGTIMFFIGAVDNKVELPASTPTEIEIEMEKKEWEEMFCWDIVVEEYEFEAIEITAELSPDTDDYSQWMVAAAHQGHKKWEEMAKVVLECVEATERQHKHSAFMSIVRAECQGRIFANKLIKGDK